ncbi:DUF86 domain-containing protein [Eubacteriaceae bacterium ES3]|nr:DUF86 domain-containing protein [Eubacteriaceae bacterium ES3]
MKKSDEERLEKITQYCFEAIAFTDDINLEIFLNDLKTIRAVTMTLVQIGELVYKLSDEIKESHHEVPWRQIAGLRHRLVHDYGNTDYAAVWEIIRINIPELQNSIKDILK